MKPFILPATSGGYLDWASFFDDLKPPASGWGIWREMKLNRKLFLFIIIVLCLSLTGCSLLQIPVALTKGTFGLFGQIFKLLNKLPKPPPWVFL